MLSIYVVKRSLKRQRDIDLPLDWRKKNETDSDREETEPGEGTAPFRFLPSLHLHPETTLRLLHEREMEDRLRLSNQEKERQIEVLKLERIDGNRQKCEESDVIFEDVFVGNAATISLLFPSPTDIDLFVLERGDGKWHWCVSFLQQRQNLEVRKERCGNVQPFSRLDVDGVKTCQYQFSRQKKKLQFCSLTSKSWYIGHR